MKNKRTFSNVEELINAIKHGYELTKDDLINHPYLCKSDEVILHVIDNINPNMVRYYKGNNVRVLEYAIDKGYTPIEEDLKKYNYINNKNIILKAIDSISPNMIKYYNGKDKEVFKYAIDKDVNCLNYINVQLSDELYKYAVEEKNYKIDLSIIMGKWTFINSLYMMKKAIDKDKIAIKYYKGRDEEVFEYAIQKGYVPKEEDLINAYHLCKSKSIIKKAINTINPNIIKYYRGNDEEVFECAVQNGYVPREEDLINNSELRNSKSIMKRAINTTSPNMIKYYNGKDEDVFEYALQNGYVPKEEDLINGYSLRRSKSIIKKAIEKDIKAIKYYEGNDEEVFKYAIDIDADCLIYIDDDVVLTEELYRYAIDKDANCLNYIKVPLSEELYKYAVEEKGYKIDLSIVMNNNFFMNSLYMMKKAVDMDVNCIKNYRGSITSIFEYAVDKGYVPREEDFKRFGYIYNKDIMLKAIDNISPNMIKYYNGKDEEVFKYAIDKGYVPNKDDFLNNIFLTDSKVIMEKLISIDPEFITFYKGDDISGLGELYFKTKNIDFLNMPSDKKRIFEKLNNRMGNDKFYLACIYNIIFEVDNDLYKKIDINFLFLIIKFIYYSDDSKNLLVSIIKNNNFDNLMQIYNFYKSGSIDIDFLKNIVLVYNEISNLCNSIVNEDYTFDDLKMLGDIIVNGNGQKIKLNNIEDLRNYRENVYNNNINISKENDIYWMKNAIFLLLLNKNYHEIKDLFETLFSTYKIINLINNIKDENIKNELENYLVFMDLIEDIYNMNDIEFLRSILLKLNERYINADNDLKVIWKEFKNIEKKAKSFYGIEILEKATDFANINKQDGIIIESKRYKPTISDVNGEKLSTQNVDYIELDGISFVTFAHVLNAYGNGAKINDFKHPRIIGKPYICLSAIDDEKYGVVDRNPIDVDHVTLLFSKISNNQLALAADHDIASYGKVNERDVKAYRNFEFKPVRDIISTTYGGQGGYNEYVMYREDDDGNYIYPSAILVVGDEPAESEINAAAYLGVPLVKINKSKYQKDSIIIENENTKEKNNSNKKMIDEYKDLRKAVEGIQQLLDNKELESIEEKGGIHR